MNRRAMLASVHIARKDLGLDEETYRDVLERVTGARSASQLSELELGKVLDAFRARGWSSPSRRRPSTPHVRKVWALWADLCTAGIPREPTRAALRAFVERMTHVADPEWLSPEEATQVIEGLKAWRKRARQQAGGA